MFKQKKKMKKFYYIMAGQVSSQERIILLLVEITETATLIDYLLKQAVAFVGSKAGENGMT